MPLKTRECASATQTSTRVACLVSLVILSVVAAILEQTLLVSLALATNIQFKGLRLVFKLALTTRLTSTLMALSVSPATLNVLHALVLKPTTVSPV